jgi:2-polyprenyl-3-methyl-5-hydroxy-6-metoxy-1,4-benzoquinol methylase
MDTSVDYLEKNRSLWNQRTAWHVAAPNLTYDIPAFLKGKSTLNEIELNLLGDVRDKEILHLQCHFGLDSLSLGRMGARVTGVDFSEEAIKKANDLASEANITANFICSDVYELKTQLQQSFDIIYTSYGVIGWLPDMDRWADIISHFLKPGGMLVFVEFHPVVWMYDNDFTKVEYSYFKSDPIIENEEGTYADPNAPMSAESVSWNHSIGEVCTALLNKGLALADIREYNYSPYNCFRHTEQIADDKFIIKPFGDKIPLVYSIIAKKS